MLDKKTLEILENLPEIAEKASIGEIESFYGQLHRAADIAKDKLAMYNSAKHKFKK